jgi:PAS domain S-box-containing protein
LRALIVDDSQDDANLIARELERGGFTVLLERVDTADAMRQALERCEWDVVLSDYRMPRFSAPEALELLHSTGTDIPFIIISGTIGEESAVAALKAGAHDFLGKDRLARLIPAIEREMGDCDQRRERRRAEEALRLSEARYRTLVDHAMFGIYTATSDGRFLTLNPSLIAMLGYSSADELLGVGMASLFVDPDVGLEFFRQSHVQGYVAGTEALWKRKNGDHVRVRLTARLRQGPASEPTVFEVIAEDVTEQHRLHEQLRQAQKMEAVGQLAGGIAHDFNNVLTAILGYSELLTDQIGPDKAIGRDLREIRIAAERAAALTQQLLAFSRKQVIAVTPIDLSAMVRNLEPMLRRLLPESVRIECRLADHLDLVMADATQLEHLLINLSVNARDAMPNGGTLTITTGNVRLDRAFVNAHQGAVEGGYAALAVIDTGSGMPADVQRRIFEPFFTTKDRGRGTGLGLAAVYGTVKQLGGYIGVESEVGRGTTFTSYLPRTEDAAERVVAPLRSAPVGAETILLVEDESGVRSFVKAALQRFGYRVVEAESAEAALELLDGLDAPIDLLLTDVVLPGIDGHELSRRVASQVPDIRVLFMSGYATALRTEEGFQIRGVELLEKPFTAQTLLSRTRQTLAADPDVRH